MAPGPGVERGGTGFCLVKEEDTGKRGIVENSILV
jgi:hypothetical protein